MDLKLFCKKVFDKAKQIGFGDCEIYYLKGNSQSVKVFNKDLNQFANSSNHGLSFRGLYNDKMGYAFTEELNENVIDMLLENAKISAELTENPDVDIIFEGAEKYETPESYGKDIKGFTTEQKMDLSFKMEEYALGLSENVFQVSNCSVNSSESEVYITNTKGLELTNKFNISYAVLSVIVDVDGSKKQWYEYWYGNDVENFDYKKLCEKTVKGALERTKAKSLPSEKYDIILKNDAMISLLSTFANIFSAKAVQDNLSLLKGKLGEKIASDKVTIVDDGMLKDGKIQLPFDAEGYPSQKTVLIENGVLKSFVHNSKSARKDGVKSTGNGFKSSYKSRVGIQMTNFYLANGKTSFDDLKKQLNKGIIIDDLSGLHAGVNKISGDFSLLASGFYVENGEVVKTVEQITIAGNYYDLLKEVEEIADDIKYDIGSNATVASPSILVRNIDVSGE